MTRKCLAQTSISKESSMISKTIALKIAYILFNCEAAEEHFSESILWSREM